jgi:hypothetical protein
MLLKNVVCGKMRSIMNTLHLDWKAHINYKYLVDCTWGIPECVEFVADMSFVGTLAIVPMLLSKEILTLADMRLLST